MMNRAAGSVVFRVGVLGAIGVGAVISSLGGCGTASGSRGGARVGGAGELGGGVSRGGSEAALDEVVGLMTGSFSSEAQARESKDFLPIVLHMTPIWTRFSGGAAGVSAGERWLYVEQAVASAADRPYRQRVYRVVPLVYTDVNGVAQIGIRSEVWELPGDPLRFAGAWRSADPLADIGPESLAMKEGCEVVLFRGVDGVWRGSTLGDGCVSTRQGAAYTTSLVEVDASGLRTLDRGFDAKGTQVWGSEKGAYEFRRK